jgi:14-3-3 protein epsilon
MDSTPKNKYIYQALLAEKCHRYKDMVSILEEYAEKKETELNNEERNLLAQAYKNKLEIYRKVLKQLKLKESDEKNKETDNLLNYLEYKEAYENKMIEKIKEMIDFINQLLQKTEEKEGILLYYKLIGDFNRYIAEFAEGDLREKAINECIDYYPKAYEMAKEIYPLNIISLGTKLNYSVFLYETIHEREKGIEVAYDSFEIACRQKTRDNVDNKEVDAFINLFKDNIIEWRQRKENHKNNE